MNKIKLNIQKYKYIYLLLLPSLIYLIIFKLFPLYGLQLAFKDYDINAGILRSEFIGFDNFKILFETPEFWNAFKNTILIGTLHLIFSFPLSIAMGIFFSELKNKKLKNFIQTIFTFPHFISWVLVASLFFSIFGNYGVINSIIQSLGGNEISFFANTWWFRFLLIISYVWKEVGWESIIYYAVLCNIDSSLYDVAKLDGASRFNIIKYIKLPALKKIIITMLLLQVGSIFTAGFSQIYNLYNPTVYNSADVLETYIYRNSFISMSGYGVSVASSLIKAGLNIILLVLAEIICRKVTKESLFYDLFSNKEERTG